MNDEAPERDIITELRLGVVIYHSFAAGMSGGEIDETATDALLDEAANRIENLQAERDALRQQLADALLPLMFEGRGDQIDDLSFSDTSADLQEKPDG